MAKYDLELAEYNARLDITRTRIKDQRSLSLIPKNSGELLVNVKTRLRKLSCSAKGEPLNPNQEIFIVESPLHKVENNNFSNELT